MINRHQLSNEELESAIKETLEKVFFRIKQKGAGSFVSSHEILGVLEDELTEYRDEVHAKSPADSKVEELKDVAVAAIIGIASIRSGGVDW